MKVNIVEYSPEWQQRFEAEKRILETVFKENTVQIEHIGSTSVEGLAAKPIIDIMIGLDNFGIADDIVPQIAALNYRYIQEFETSMPYRRFFVKEEDGIRTHQIHLVEAHSEFWERLILFRDYLRQNPLVADQYAALKKDLARREWLDVDEYADAKTEFVKVIEDEAKLNLRRKLKMTQIEENKRIVWRWFDFISEHKMEKICEIISPFWTMHGGPRNLPPGEAGVRELFRTFGKIKQKWTIEETIAEDDKVVVRATNECLQESFFGVPGRGIVQNFSAIFIHKIANGKIIETWRNADDLGRIFQLGGRIESPQSEHF